MLHILITGGGMPDYGYASTISLLIVLLAVLLMRLYYRLSDKSAQYVTVTGRGYRPVLLDVGRWKWPLLLCILFYFFISTMMPVFILLWGSLLPSFYQAPSIAALHNLSPSMYLKVFRLPGVVDGLINTILLMLGTATFTMALSTVVSWLIVKKRGRGSSMLDTLSFLPITIPSVVLGLVIMYEYLTIPIPIYGTIWIIMVGLTTRYVAFGCRTMNVAFLQIHNELDEAGVMSGASWFSVFRKVTLPLVFPAFLNGWLWVAIHAIRELSIALMLFSPNSVVISTLIWNLWANGNTCAASALSAMLVVITTTIILLIRLKMPTGMIKQSPRGIDV